jgi:uncharacterized protein YndB with AHSA1/START domain
VQRTANEEASMPARQVIDIRGAQYELSVSIEASPHRVWRALTDQLNSWWLPDFHMLGPESTVILEAWAGGRLYETCGDNELLWYTVLAIEPEKALSMVGYCTPDFGGPMTTMLVVKLQRDGESTTLSITDALYGRVTDAQVESLQAGWTRLFTDGLKASLESGSASSAGGTLA